MAAAFLGDVDMAVDLLGPVFEIGTSSSFVRFAMADPDLAEARKNPQIREMLTGATKRLPAVSEANSAAFAEPLRS